MSDRLPKFTFVPRPKTYGKLDISHELIVCRVHQGRLIEAQYPSSWEAGVNVVGTAEQLRRYLDYRQAYDEWWAQHAAWRAENNIPPEPHYGRNTSSRVGQRQWKDYEAAVAGKPPEPSKRFAPVKFCERLVLLGLNDRRDSYEVIYDPHGLEADIDPMMLLNFRRKV